MLDAQALVQAVPAVQQAAPFVNWSVNVIDLLSIGGCAALLYGRLVKLETQIGPIVQWWNKLRSEEHIGRRWTDDPPQARRS